ncbi:MAG: hypothetical protein JW936_09805 [Sedimentisphaerales bacterium]|nr:hypothetical protein [Sedimentisphaerales bacterium]
MSEKLLDAAYQAALARLERLTARGPLRFYRSDLLTDARNAFRRISKWGQSKGEENLGYHNMSRSVVAKEALKRGQLGLEKGPVRSDIKKGSILPGKPIALRGRDVKQLRDGRFVSGVREGVRENGDVYVESNGRTKREQALVEDAFCRDVIHRLEGDLLRFDSRKVLLRKAEEMDIGLFQANMLMAQIVEAVRQNKLHVERPGETFELNADKLETGKRAIKRSKSKTNLLAAGLIAAAVVVDWLIIRWLAA